MRHWDYFVDSCVISSVYVCLYPQCSSMTWKKCWTAAQVVYVELTSFGFLCSFLDIAKLIAFSCKKHVIKLCRIQSFPSFYITLPLRYHRCTLSHGRIFSLFASLLLRFCTFRYKGCNITKRPLNKSERRQIVFLQLQAWLLLFNSSRLFFLAGDVRRWC